MLDFKIIRNDNSFFYLEIKGHSTLTDEAKLKAVKDQEHELQIWRGLDLKQFNILRFGSIRKLQNKAFK